MKDDEPSKIRYNSLKNFSSLEELVNEGESEDLFWECKAPLSPQVNPGLRAHLATAISGFSNAEGGVLIYGMETNKHSQSGIDVMTSVTKVGNINAFTNRLVNTIPTLTVPAVTRFEHKIIKRRKSDTAGVLVVHIPRASHPVQSQGDKRFYFRGGDQFVDAPYSTIERLFLATESPNIEVELVNHKLTDRATHQHKIGIALRNQSTAVGRDVDVFVEIINPSNAQKIESDMDDASSVNDGRKTYTSHTERALHYKYGLVIASLNVIMKGNKRKFAIRFTVYADKMIPKKYLFECIFTKTTFKIVKRQLLDK